MNTEVATESKSIVTKLIGQANYRPDDFLNYIFLSKNFGIKSTVQLFYALTKYSYLKILSAFNIRGFFHKQNFFFFFSIIVIKHCQKNQTARFLCQNMYLIC